MPTDIAVVGPGTYYFVSGEIIRKITSDGIINVAVGKRVEGFNGDGLPLSSTQLNSPQGIALDRNSNLYISDSLNHRIRKVTPAGEVSTFAGNRNPGLSGDDGRTISEIAFPQGIAFGPDSNLYIAEQPQ